MVNKNKTNKKVLMISYYFAPSGSTGGIRSLKFVKYLRDFGWEPIVLSSKSGFDYNVKRDAKLLDQIPHGIKVYRTLSFEPSNWLWSRSNNKKQTSVDRSTQSKDGICLKETRQKTSIIRKLKNIILNILSWPDNFAGWVPFALVRGLYIIIAENIDVIYVTVPPHSVLLTGYLLSLLTGKKLVVDYRDPWLKRIAVEKFVEKKVLESAEQVIFTSKKIYEKYVNEYPDICKEKFNIIHNGFDPLDDVDEKNILIDRSKLLFVHAGYLYSMDGVKNLLKAFSELIEDDPSFEKKIDLTFIGSRPKTEYFDFLEEKNIAKHISYLSREECFQFIKKEAHVLLAFLPEHFAMAGCVPSKIFDAMLFNKPILSIMANGAAQDVIKETSLGEAIIPDDLHQIKKSILKFYRAFADGNLSQFFNEKEIQKYNRINLTENLTEVFNAVVES